MSIWDDWLKSKTEPPKAITPEPARPPEKDKENEKRRITAQELAKLKRLRNITPQQASMDKRFIRQMGSADEFAQITNRQGWFIEILWYKYRRQLGHDDPEPVGYKWRSREVTV